MNITPYFNNQAYIVATAAQIKKDFEFSGLTFQFSNDPAHCYNELLYQISPLIADLIDKKFDKLLNLLYRIDIPENKISDLMTSNAFGSLPEAIADLVIRRELLKVVIRRNC